MLSISPVFLCRNAKILNKLNYNVEILDLKNECCGLMYHSMGHPIIGKKKFDQLLKKIKQKNNEADEIKAVLIENSSCFLEILTQSNENGISPLFQDPIALTIFDEDHSQHEERWITVGNDNQHVLLVVIHTWHEINQAMCKVRIISVRKATRMEQTFYQDQSI